MRLAMLIFSGTEMSKVAIVAILILSITTFKECSDVNKIEGLIRGKIAEVGKRFAPDRRTSIWDIKVDYRRGKFIVSGETDCREGLDSLFGVLETKFPRLEFRSEVLVLPEDVLGEESYGLIVNSVAHLRREPSVSSEMVSQTLMGHMVRLLKEECDYYLVKCDDGYIGWVSSSSVARGRKDFVDKWFGDDLYVFYDVEGRVYQEPSYNSYPISDIVLGNIVRFIGRKGNWFYVVLPDGRKGFVPRYQMVSYKKYKAFRPTPHSVVHLAKKLLGRPYLWGGTSTKAMDCSGFVQTVFRNVGLLLPRDANMQVNVGVDVDTSNSFEKLKPGDLLFFGPDENRITHVGIYIGNCKFIHSSGRVKISSLVSSAENYSEGGKKSLRRVKRVIQD